MAANTIRYDPTRTTLIRRAFLADMRRRFGDLRKAIVALVADENAFALGTGTSAPTGADSVPALHTIPIDAVLNTTPEAVAVAAALIANARWAFETDAGKMHAYQGWLQQQVNAGILEVDPLNASQPWTQPYIRSAYKKGMVRAYTDVKRLGGPSWEFAEGGKGAFMKMAFESPVAQGKLEILSTRTYTGLKGITAQMDADMSRILAQGMADGRGPRELARALAKDVSGLEKKRALTLARTETTFAHSEGQLDAFEAMNIQEVGVMAEWSTATDGNVCELCSPLEGVILTIAEARGMIPRHPNCRCAWIPAGVGEHKGGTTKSVWAGPEQGLMPPGTLPTGKTTGQVWHKDEVGSRIRESYKAEFPKLPTKAARTASRWIGADKKITGKLKPGSKKWYAFKEAEAAKMGAELEVAKKEAAQSFALAKLLHSQKVKVGLAKKKFGLKDDWLWIPPGEEVSQLSTTGLNAYLEKKGVTTATPDDKSVVLKAKAAHPATPTLAVQMDEAQALVIRKLAEQEEAALQAGKALHALKVKVGMTKKKYGLKKDWLFHPGDGPLPTLTSDGAEAYALRRGMDEWTATDWPAIIDDWKAILAADPGKPVLTAQMEALEAHVQKRIAGRKAAEAATGDVKAAVAAWKKQTAPSSDVLDLADYDNLPGWAPPKTKTQSYGTIIFDGEGRVLMREPKGHYGGAHWTFAKGGGTKPGSTALAELAEETGHQGAIHGVVPGAFKGTTTKTNYFVGISKGFDAGLMDLETEATKWMTFKEAVEAIAKSKSPKVVSRDTHVLKAAFAALGDPDAQAAFAALKKTGGEAFEEAKKAAAKAAHSHKVKLGMAQKHYAKDKFGGGVVDMDWVNPATKQKLTPSGVNKVLSEKGWHTTTLPPDTAQMILAADDVVQQKAVMDALKKAPKGTAKVAVVDGPRIDKQKLMDLLEGPKYGKSHAKVSKFVRSVFEEPTYAQQVDFLEGAIGFGKRDIAHITVGPVADDLLIDGAKLQHMLETDYNLPAGYAAEVVAGAVAKKTLQEQLDHLAFLVKFDRAELDRITITRAAAKEAAKEAKKGIPPIGRDSFWGEHLLDEDGWIDLAKAKKAFKELGYDDFQLAELVDIIAEGTSYETQVMQLGKYAAKNPPKGFVMPPDPVLDADELFAHFAAAYPDGSRGAIQVFVAETLAHKGAAAQLSYIDNFHPVAGLTSAAKKKLVASAADMVGKPLGIEVKALAHYLDVQGAVTSKAFATKLAKQMTTGTTYHQQVTKLIQKLPGPLNHDAINAWLEHVVIFKYHKKAGAAARKAAVRVGPTPRIGKASFWTEDLLDDEGWIDLYKAKKAFRELGFADAQVADLVDIIADGQSFGDQVFRLGEYAAKHPPKGAAAVQAVVEAKPKAAAKAAVKARAEAPTTKALDPGKVQAFIEEIHDQAGPDEISEVMSAIFSKPTFKAQYDALLDGVGMTARDVVGDPALVKEFSELVTYKKLLHKPKPTPKAPPLPKAPKAATPFEVPLERDLKKIKDLPGSTRPYLAVDKTGKKWVVKDTSGSEIVPGHLRSEGLADELYRVMGFDVPNGAVVEAPGGVRKVTEFLEGGQTLAEWKAGKGKAAVRLMYKKIKRGFVADCLVANHDVAGLSFDNIFVVGNKAYRIDNGGALTYRAQGGAKRTWGPKVKELATMRDASTNPQTAAIFGDITEEEIQEQIISLVAKRAEILQAIPDDGVRATMAARLDDLAAKLPATRATRPRKAVPVGKRRAAYAPDAEAVRRAKDARSNGIVMAGDRDKIEDCNVLVWEEVGEAGPVTRMQFKVTKRGSDSMVDALGDELVKARRAVAPGQQAASNIHPDDHYWDTVLKALKTVNHHAKDGEYNLSTITELVKVRDEIALSLGTAKGAKKKMLLHYQKAIEEIGAAKEAGGTTGKLAQYVYKPPAKKAVPVPVRRALRVRRDNGIDYRLVDYGKGEAKPAAGRNFFSTAESYVIETDEGAKIKFIPNDGSYSDAQGRALHGTVTVELPEEMTEEAIRKAMGLLDDIGVNTAPPSAAFEEALYLHRGVYINGKHTGAAYKAIWESADLTDEQRVKQLKAWIKTNMKIDVNKVPHYDPAGIARHADGSGFRHWERWDLGAEQIAKKMDDYSVFHSTGSLSSSPEGRVAKTLAAILDSDGEFTSTTGRIRKGVSVNSTGGASSSSDINSGGASYFFCRIKKDTSTAKGFYFRVGTLSRQDAISYRSDNYGRISNLSERASTVAEYKRFAQNGSNETIFKEGLSLDDIDFIRVHNDTEVRAVLKVFKDRGIDSLPDGRKVEDVVVAGQRRAKKRRKGR